ncbi:MAG: ABC transporter substrate-binding protein [Chloroflexi bacterium]|nr:MAG: ABC transporter substrate-binding protein [Chloroflexota bacterium]
MHKKFSRLFVVVFAALLVFSLMGPASAQDERTVVMGSLVDVFNIDPAVGFDQAIGSTLKQFYDAPFRYVGNPPVVEPWLAESWEVSDDGLVYTINLRQDAVFHDGSPVNADAVVFSAERLLRIGQGAGGLYQGVLSPGNTVALDEFTVQFTLDEPFGPFLDILTWMFIVNPAIVEANAGDDDAQSFLAENEAGSGPFRQGRWQPGELYELIAVDDYWRGWPNENHPSSVIRLKMVESSTRRLALESGEADIIDWMSPDEIAAIADAGAGQGVPFETLTVYDVKMNTVEGPTSDPNLRRAIAYAVDYDAIPGIWAGQASLINGPLPPAVSTVAEPVYRQDLDAAREALAQSAFPDGVELEYVYVVGLEVERLTGLVLQDSLAEIGIDVSITAIPWADAVASFADPETSPDLFPLFSSTAYADPDNYLWSGFHSSQAGVWTNPGHYSNPEVDALLEAGRASTDPEERREIYAQAEQLILADSPNLFLVTTPENLVIGPRLTNYFENYNPVMGSSEDFYFYAVGE